MTYFKNEYHFTQSIRKAAQQLGWLEYHTCHTPDKKYLNKTSPGFPDLVLTKNGIVIFAELKMPKGKLTIAQKEWAKALRKSEGVKYYLWRPDDWDFILEILNS